MSEEYMNINQETEQRPKRPVLLTVLCILSFITIGFGLMGLLFSLIAGAPSAEEIENTYNISIQAASDLRDQNAVMAADFFERVADLAVYQQHRFLPVQLLNTVMLITGFIGVLFMFRGKRLGFHLYIIYNLLSVGGIYLIVPFSMVPNILLVLGLFFAGLFVFLYSLNLKWMNK